MLYRMEAPADWETTPNPSPGSLYYLVVTDEAVRYGTRIRPWTP